MKLLVLALCFLFACAGGETTTLQNDDGLGNIGTLGAPLIRRTFDTTPATSSYDLNNATQLGGNGSAGPFLVSLSAWVTADDASAGALIFTMNYDDPTSQTREVNFGNSLILLLNDPTSFFSTPVLSLMRESDTSLWELNTTLAGSAGTSTVHYEILVHPENPSDVTFFSDQ